VEKTRNVEFGICWGNIIIPDCDQLKLSSTHYECHKMHHVYVRLLAFWEHRLFVCPTL